MKKNWITFYAPVAVAVAVAIAYLLLGCQHSQTITPLALTVVTETQITPDYDLSTQAINIATEAESYLPAGKIVYISDNTLYIMDGNGETKRMVGGKIKRDSDGTSFYREYYSLSLPHWSPDGTRLAVACGIYFSSAEKYAELNLCILNGPVDEWNLDKVARAPVIVKIDSGGYGYSGLHISSISWSPDGSQIAVVSQVSENYFCLVDTETYQKDCGFPPKVFDGFSKEDKDILGFSTFSWSPVDENKVVVPKLPGVLSLVDLAKKKILVLTEVPYICYVCEPVWSPDESMVAFIYREHFTNDKNNIIAIANIDGSGYTTLIDGRKFMDDVINKMFLSERSKEYIVEITPASWSPDGRFLLIEAVGSNFSGIFRYDLQTNEIRPLKFDFGYHTYSSPNWGQ